ncbi:hypothetical protein BH10PAT2_BH10PAT2_2020 [soil metagenome]
MPDYMDQSTLKKLNTLNQKFYDVVSEKFSETREVPWSGWTELIPLLQEKFSQTSLTVLDIGGGNGRFGVFLKTHFTESTFTYVDLDSSPKLLLLAERSLVKTFSKDTYVLETLDLVEKVPEMKADLIVLFGVLHHLPSRKLRTQRIQQLAKLLNPGGILIFTAWQFDQLPNIFNRRQSSHELGFEKEELEENDYFLTWERGVQATRYCHLLNQTEIDDLITSSGLKLIKQFPADGKNCQTNQYIVLRR